GIAAVVVALGVEEEVDKRRAVVGRPGPARLDDRVGGGGDGGGLGRRGRGGDERGERGEGGRRSIAKRARKFRNPCAPDRGRDRTRRPPPARAPRPWEGIHRPGDGMLTRLFEETRKI